MNSISAPPSPPSPPPSPAPTVPPSPSPSPTSPAPSPPGQGSPSPPPSPPSIPHGAQYQFVFTGVVGLTAPGLTADDVSLSGIVLYDADGHPIPVESASNPGGDPHGNHPATYLIDGDGETKWLDTSYKTAHSSTVVLTLAAPTEVHSYMLITSKDVHKRTPTDWTFSVLRPGGGVVGVGVRERRSAARRRPSPG